MAITQSPFPKGDVIAVLNYFKAPEDGSAPFNYVNTPPEGQPQRNHGDDYKETLIHDIRGSESDFTLDRDSFLVVSGVPPSKETEFVDDVSIEANYYPEVRDILLKNIPGSNKVLIFDHTIRRSDPKATRSPVLKVHIDQTAKSAALRVKRHLPDEAEKLLAGRYRIVNVWRPLNKKPVESSPLAFASSSTLKDSDVHPVSHRYANGYVGETAGIAHSPDQKWYFLSGMTGEERLLLQCFDSEALKENSEVQGGRLAHTAFSDPRTLPGAEGRESIEVRALVFGP